MPENAKGSAQKAFRIDGGRNHRSDAANGLEQLELLGQRSGRGEGAAKARGHGRIRPDQSRLDYINIDDAWQGKRGGLFNAIQGNEKFPDMKGLCDTVHRMGLKVGIYSTPWVTSYANHIGGSAENPEGDWSPPTIPKKGHVNKKILPWAIGKYSLRHQ